MPTGEVTFMFTDIEGSTRLWESAPGPMAAALERHDAAVRAVVHAGGGSVVKLMGDGALAVFEHAADAVVAAVEFQRAVKGLEPEPALRVRAAVHTGIAVERDGDYFGPTLNRTARLMAAAHGGQILVSAAATALARERLPGGVSFLDLGDHRLRDLAAPERISQVVALGLDEVFPPLRSLDAAATNLPVQLTSFVGRTEELGALREVLLNHRLLTITGVGGVGKTRLALQLGAEVVSEFKDGVWLCELAAAEDAEAVGEIATAALGARPRPGLSSVASLVEFLASKELLLVMDNCEHVLDEAAELIEAVMTGCPNIRVLATSREGIGVAGERLYPLRSLATVAAATPLDVALGTDALELFRDRAALVVPGFTIDERNVADVAEICRRLDGIPLAIELAAARVTSMSPSEIASMLDERFRLLTGGRRRAVERHHTLRAAVDWSYELLDETDRKVFGRLGVFSGGFDAVAAQAVAGAEELTGIEVLDALRELVAKSMVIADHPDSTTRYWLLETLRQYALEQLASAGEADQCRRRHAEHYAGFAEDIGPLLCGPHELAWRPRLGVEIDNLRSAVGWALERHATADAELGMRVLAGISRETVLSRRFGIGGWAERAIESAATRMSGHRPAVMTVAAFGAFHSGDLDRAEWLARQALDADADNAWARMAIANVLAQRGDLASAVSQLQAATERPIPNVFDSQSIHSVIAIYQRDLGAQEEALRAAQHAVDSARSIGHPSALALALYARGYVRTLEDPPSARDDLNASRQLVGSGAADVALGYTLLELARLDFEEGRLTAAADLVTLALQFHDESGDRPPMIGPVSLALRIFDRLGDQEALAVGMGAVLEGYFSTFAPMALLLKQLPDAAGRAVSGDTPDHAEDHTRGASMSYENFIRFLCEHLGHAGHAQTSSPD